MLSGCVTGETKTQADGFGIEADASVSVAGAADLTAHLTIANAAYEEIAFSGGEAIDLSNPTEAQTQRVKDEIVKQATALTISFATKLDVIDDLMTLLK